MGAFHPAFGNPLTDKQLARIKTLGQRYIKSADPTVNDDSGEGYAVWDKWLNTVSGEAYVCLDATEGAADWQNMSLDVDDLSDLFDAKVDKVEDHSLIADTEIARLAWMFAKKTITTAISGAVTIDPADGHRQEATVDGNITDLTCALSEATPSVVLELTAEAAYTLDLTGWETDEGVPFDLKSGKSILLLSLSADGVTKYAFLVGQEVA